ncbi:MAG TPA: nitronate monooxygenase [Candidatus Limnocylindrales bacterium]|nr:nitronate monooxygenase [Candidatus Limnocylindrales bacterium]
MIKTAFTELLGIEHPIALAGMSGFGSPELVAAVSNAGGLGILGATDSEGATIRELVGAIREMTRRPFGVNLLLHGADDEQMQAVLEARPAVLSTAWPRDDQDLAAIFASAHERGIKVLHMVPTAADAAAAAAAGADVIVAQGTDGGGHIGLVGTAVIVPMVANVVAPTPVLAAGGIADGRGLAAMLALGAEGVLVGTRFLATTESPLHEAFKKLIVDSDGTDTIVTDLADVMLGVDWPGAVDRIVRNRAVERWLGRTNELRRQRDEVVAAMREARRVGDADEAIVYFGQSAALIREVMPAGDVMAQMIREAVSILRERLPSLVVD